MPRLWKTPPKLIWPTYLLGLTVILVHLFQFLTWFFDHRQPIVNNRSLFFQPSMVLPEPHKIPIYLVIMSTAAAILIIGRTPLQQFLSALAKNSQFCRLIPYFFGLLLLYFVWLLGLYPMFGWDQVTVLRSLAFGFYIACWAGLLFFLPKLSIKHKIIESLVVLAVVIAFTYMPTFPVSFFDYSYLIGPAYSAASGQTLYTQAPSQYGFGSILLFALAEKNIPGILLNLGIFMWGLYVLQVMLCFWFVRKTTDSFSSGLLIVASLITLSFFSIVSIPFGIPQASAFRWIQFVIAFLLILMMEKSKNKLLLLPVAMLTFLVVDVGIAINISLFLYWGLRFLARNISLSALIKNLVIYGVCLVIAYFFFTLLSFSLGGHVIDLGLMLHTLSQYGRQGFGMLPLDQHSYFWLYMLTMITSFAIYARAIKETSWSRAVLLSALLFMTGAIYMVGRSHPHNLLNISPLFLLNLFVLLTPLWRKHNKKVFILFFILLVAMPAFFRANNLSHLLREKIGRLPIAQSLPTKMRTDFTVDFERDLRTLPQTYQAETKLLQETFPQAKQPIAIFALNSTYFHYLSQRPSLLWSDPLNTIIQISDLEHALLPITQSACPAIIALDPQCIDKTTCHRPPNEGILVAHDIVYQQFTHICGTYIPFRCAGVLCVARRTL